MNELIGEAISLTKGKSLEFQNTTDVELVAEITTEAGSKITASLRIGQGIQLEPVENCKFHLRRAEFSPAQLQIVEVNPNGKGAGVR